MNDQLKRLEVKSKEWQGAGFVGSADRNSTHLLKCLYDCGVSEGSLARTKMSLSDFSFL